MEARKDSASASLAAGVEIVGRTLSAEGVDRRSGIGAHLRTTVTLKANAVILTESPFAAVPMDDLASSSAICHQCFVDIDPDGADSMARSCCCCAVCSAAWYCSDACRSKAAAVVHSDSSADAGDGECSTLRRLRGSFDGTRDARLLCRIQRTQHNALCKGRKPLVSSNVDQAFDDLVYHDAPEDSETARCAAESVATANQILPPSLAIDDEESGISAVLRIRANGFSLLDGGGQPAGVGLYLTAAYFNHSCVPNVCVTNSGNQLVFRTIRPIDTGEELVISYMDAAEQTDARQEKLGRAYGFKCGCLRCTQTAHSTRGSGMMLPAMIDDEGDEDPSCEDADSDERRSHMRLVRLEAESLYAELQRCAEDGALSRGIAILTKLCRDERLAQVLHPHSRAVFAHMLESHRDTLQCSVQP